MMKDYLKKSVNEKGEFHTEDDLPAVIYSNGNKYWYKNGLLTREDGKPQIETSDGAQFWYDGPRLVKAIYPTGEIRIIPT